MPVTCCVSKSATNTGNVEILRPTAYAVYSAATSDGVLSILTQTASTVNMILDTGTTDTTATIEHKTWESASHEPYGSIDLKVSVSEFIPGEGVDSLGDPSWVASSISAYTGATLLGTLWRQRLDGSVSPDTPGIMTLPLVGTTVPANLSIRITLGSAFDYQTSTPRQSSLTITDMWTEGNY